MPDQPYNSAAEGGFDTEDVKNSLAACIHAAERTELAAVLDEIWSCGGFRLSRGPEKGLFMVPVRDSFGIEFHLGEVLVTRVEILFGSTPGWGMLLGDEPERAMLLAAVDGAVHCRNLDVLNPLKPFLDQWTNRAACSKALESKVVAATAVRFESMNKETVDFGSLGG